MPTIRLTEDDGDYIIDFPDYCEICDAQGTKKVRSHIVIGPPCSCCYIHVCKSCLEDALKMINEKEQYENE